MAQDLTRQNFLLAGAGAMAGLTVLGLGACSSEDVEREKGRKEDIERENGRKEDGEKGTEEAAAPFELEVLGSGYPRAFSFLRQVDNDLRSGSLSYAEWEKRHLALNGIMGKVLSEERGSTGADNLSVFRRYKAENPGKLLLLYYNGRGRGATNDATARFFAGHWLYYAGTELMAAVDATASQTELRVADTSVFSLERFAGSPPDDVAIAAAGEDGKPNWREAEHARLKDIDSENKTITVERGAYGTRMGSFQSGAYVAAHVTSGAYPQDDASKTDVPFWSYNYSTAGPRDAGGRTGGEALADYLAGKLGPGGELSAFDGINFDALEFVPVGLPAEQIDADSDGEADGGVLDGVNVYGLGTLRFASDLREGLPGKLILADCTFPDTLQRSFGQLNGVESEGYPDLFDYNLDQLSKGANLLEFWRENSASPSLNYVNFKYRQKDPPKNRNTFTEPSAGEDESYRKMRLALASAVLSDTAFTYPPDWAPPEVTWRRENARVRIFDELWRGTGQEPNWLGRPKGPAVSLAADAPDLLGGRGEVWPKSFVGRFRGTGVAFARATGNTTGLIISGDPDRDVPVLERTMAFSLPGIRVLKQDLFVSLRLSASPLGGYPASVARRVYVTATSDGGGSHQSFTWAGEAPFTSTFDFQGVGPGSVALGFSVEGDAPVRLHNLTARSAANAAYREFENGAVFVNNSTRPYTFEAGKLFPDASFRRIQGSANQDPATNNGQPLGATLTLGPRDALFVARSIV